jgi:hypothetical protein
MLTPRSHSQIQGPSPRQQVSTGVCITMTVTVSEDTTLCPNRRNLHRVSKGVRVSEPEILRR